MVEVGVYLTQAHVPLIIHIHLHTHQVERLCFPFTTVSFAVLTTASHFRFLSFTGLAPLSTRS